MPRAESVAQPAKKTTTIEETIPARGAGSEESWIVSGRPCSYTDLPDFWWYIEHLTEEQRSDHITYLYRMNPPSTDGVSANIAKFDTPFTEEYVREHWGGRTFRILMKRRGERLFDFRIANEDAPKYPGVTQPTQTAGANGTAGADIHPLVKQLLDVLERQNKEMSGGDLLKKATENALDLQKTTFVNATNAVREMSGHPSTPTEKSSLERVLETAIPPLVTGLAAWIVKAITDPKPDPIQTFKSMMETMNSLGLNPGGGAGDDWKTIVAKNLPTVTSHLAGIVHEWASVQVPPGAIRRTAVAQPIPIAAQPAPGSREAQPTAAPAAAAQADGSTGLIKLLVDRLNAGDTGSEIAILLERVAPQIYQTLSGHTAEELFGYFHRVPDFRPIAIHPRLRQVLAEFVIYDTETSGDIIDMPGAKQPEQPPA